MSVPPVIHQTWRDRDLPPEMARLAETWRRHHPRWRYRLWTDDDCRGLIARYAPGFLPIYDGYPEAIMRVDAFRYFLMLHLGGVYADLDLECLRPLDALVGRHGAAVALEPAEHLGEDVVRASGLARVVGNAWLASAPGHPFWEHLIARLARARFAVGPLETTGPFLLTRALGDWPGEEPAVLASDTVYPLDKRSVWAGILRDPETRPTLRARGALAIHHWMGTWVHREAPRGPRETPLRLAFRGRLVDAGTFTRATPDSDQPLISALMVTRNRRALAAASIECFRRQTWNARELVIVDDGPDEALAGHVEALGDSRVRLIRLPDEGKPLGALRNRAVAEARGTYVCQWDDDDLSHPERMARQLEAIRALRAEACVLHRETLWWPREGRVAASCARLWESSLLALKAILPAYPSLRRGEDTPVIEALARGHRVAVLDRPDLQVYLIHGGNTFGADHFGHHWQVASERREGAAATVWERDQAAALPVEAVRAALGAPTRAGDRPRSLSGTPEPRVLVLTPVKDASTDLDRFVSSLRTLDWPRDRLSLGFLESDSRDDTFARLTHLAPELRKDFRRARVEKLDFGFHLAGPRWEPAVQRQRRSILARSRNELLRHSLAAEDDWVLWLDVDVVSWPVDLIQRLLACGKEIVVPHVVSRATGDTFDLNTWRRDPAFREQDQSRWLVDGLAQPPRGLGRQYLRELHDQELVEVDAVGGCTLLVRADLHRDGLLFPDAPVEGLIETEGLAVLARRRGYSCFGLPNLQVVHA